jgi:hypothetical protein
MFDGGVDLPHRCVLCTGFDVVRVADCLCLTLDASPLPRRTQFAIHQSGKLGPIQRIAAWAIDANQVEFARWSDHEADRPSAHRTGNRSNVSLHVLPSARLNHHGYP